MQFSGAREVNPSPTITRMAPITRPTTVSRTRPRAIAMMRRTRPSRQSRSEGLLQRDGGLSSAARPRGPTTKMTSGMASMRATAIRSTTTSRARSVEMRRSVARCVARSALLRPCRRDAPTARDSRHHPAYEHEHFVGQAAARRHGSADPAHPSGLSHPDRQDPRGHLRHCRALGHPPRRRRGRARAL